MVDGLLLTCVLVDFVAVLERRKQIRMNQLLHKQEKEYEKIKVSSKRLKSVVPSKLSLGSIKPVFEDNDGSIEQNDLINAMDKVADVIFKYDFGQGLTSRTYFSAIRADAPEEASDLDISDNMSYTQEIVQTHPIKTDSEAQLDHKNVNIFDVSFCFALL